MEVKPEFVTVQLTRDVINRKELLEEFMLPTWEWALQMHGDEFEVTIRPVPKIDEASPE